MEQSWSGAAHAPTNGAAQRLSERAPAIPETSPGLIQPPYPAPTSFMNIPDLPDAARWWAAQKFFMIMWMVASILVILVSGNILNFVAGILGTVGACLHVCPCCGGPQLSGPVKVTSYSHSPSRRVALPLPCPQI